MATLNTTNFHGLTGEILDFTSCRGSLVGNLVHHLVFFGAGLGRYPHLKWRGKIFPALNCVLIGPSGCGKGESLGIIRELYTFPLDKQEFLASEHNVTITSGKRLVSIICNAMETFEEEGENRFLGIDEECASTFRCAKIWTGTLSGILIKLIDGQKIEEKVGGQVVNLPAFHYSSVGHITPRALKKSFGNEQFTNGLGNRFLYLDIPKPEFSFADGNYDEQQMSEVRKALIDSLDKGGQRELVEFGEGTFQEFTDYVMHIRTAMEEDNPIHSMQERLPKMCLRIALILALVNQEETVSRQSMSEAITIVEYARGTLERIFGADSPVSQDSPENIIKGYLKESGCISRTDLTTGLSGKLVRRDIEAGLQKLIAKNVVRMFEKTLPRGRRPHFYELV